MISGLIKRAKMTLNVTTMGLEPTRPCEHQPLKLASLPISPRRQIKKAKLDARLL